MTAPIPSTCAASKGSSTTTGPVGSATKPWNRNGITNATGRLIDQPHLRGVLAKVCDLGVTLIAVTPAG